VTKKRRVRRTIQRERDQRRKLRDVEDMPPAIADALKASLGREPRVMDVGEIQMGMFQAVLKRMVELRLAQWTETVLIILKDQHGFTQEQLADFAREFRERSGEQATETQP
jgi:hypothetical protein